MLRERNITVEGGAQHRRRAVRRDVLWRHESATAEDAAEPHALRIGQHYPNSSCAPSVRTPVPWHRALRAIVERSCLRSWARDRRPARGGRERPRTDRRVGADRPGHAARARHLVSSGASSSGSPPVGIEGTFGSTTYNALGRAGRSGHINDVDALAGYVARATTSRCLPSSSTTAGDDDRSTTAWMPLWTYWPVLNRPKPRGRPRRTGKRALWKHRQSGPR